DWSSDVCSSDLANGACFRNLYIREIRYVSGPDFGFGDMQGQWQYLGHSSSHSSQADCAQARCSTAIGSSAVCTSTTAGICDILSIRFRTFPSLAGASTSSTANPSSAAAVRVRGP